MYLLDLCSFKNGNSFNLEMSTTYAVDLAFIEQDSVILNLCRQEGKNKKILLGGKDKE